MPGRNSSAFGPGVFGQDAFVPCSGKGIAPSRALFFGGVLSLVTL